MTQKKEELIKKVVAREILDSRGNPTIEAEVHLENGAKAWSQVPSGASTGSAEALELRDGDPERYHGRGVMEAIKNIHTELTNLVVGMDAADQRALDDAMIALDGTEGKSRLGANAILAVSLAACRAMSVSRSLPLYRYIADLQGTNELEMPMPMFNIVNGGAHADNNLPIQEYKIVPHGVETFKEQYRAGSEIFHTLKKNFKEVGLNTGVGDEGGFAPVFDSTDQPLEEIIAAVSDAGYKPGKEVSVGIDAAANFFYCQGCDGYSFKMEDKAMTRAQLIALYERWIDEYHFVSIEDGLREEDWPGWTELNQALGDKVMLIGDDLLVTNVKRLERAIVEKTCNAVLVKPNQIGSLTETLDFIVLAQKNDMNTIMSHRSGETIDDFIADLAVGAGTTHIKAGSLSRGERIVKYNRLLAIEEQLAV